jgi:hypothetical protein
MLVSLFCKPGANICLSPPSLQERRALERKISEMEEELKVLSYVTGPSMYVVGCKALFVSRAPEGFE